ncbi:MAG: carboxypeptidase-like regulatory domain-containing protein [Longimicrobiales bacterium]
MPCPSQFTLCHEKWSDMTPQGRGRLCAKCDKVLIDFTGMSEEEIRAFHGRNPGTCGIYTLSQFHKPASQVAAAAAAAVIGLAVPEFAQAVLQEPTAEFRQTQIEPADSVVVKGTVVDSTTNQPIAGAMITVTGTRLGTITDSNGEFRIVVRSAITFPIRIQAQVIGYTSKEASVSSADGLANMKFALTQTIVEIVGIVVTGQGHARQTGKLAPIAKPSILRRLVRTIGGK